MRKLLLLISLAIFSEHCTSQIGYAEFSNESVLSDWRNGIYENVSGTIINLGLKRGTYVVHWKFQVDSAFWLSPKVLHIANPIIDNVEVYQITKDSIFHQNSGEKIPLGFREFNISGNLINNKKRIASFGFISSCFVFKKRSSLMFFLNFFAAKS